MVCLSVERMKGALGPSFDLPDVPLMPNSGATIELGSDQFKEAIAGADFELDDVELDSSHAEWAGAELDSAAEHLEPAHDPNAQTMEEVGLFTVQNGKITKEEFFYSMG